MARFAKGKYALAISDISGQAFPWNEMVTQWNGLFVHFSEFESKQPQLDPKPSAADPTALPKTRPQQPSPDTLRFLDFNPLTTFAAASGTINVKSLDHQRNYNDTVRFRGAPTTSSAASTDPQFSNIANIDGISGATICQASGFSIYPGQYTSTTTTLNGTIDATTTTVILTSETGFNGVATGVYEPTITNPTGVPTWGILIGSEIISYTGMNGALLTGVTRGAFGSTASTHNTGVAVRLLKTPANYYHLHTGATATTGQISGGGYNVSSGPVTLKTIGPQ
jgi:hypothetical protein